MAQFNRLRLLSYVVIFYMLLAFAWWSVLLFTKNKDAFEAKRDKMFLLMIAEGSVKNNAEFILTKPYIDLEAQYERQEWMILGEALVFVLSLVIGVWLINRGYNKEMDAAQQQRNFLLSITHELKSPIASIKLVLETFRKRQLKQELVDKLTNNGLLETERLNTLVNDLLLSAKLESAYQPNTESIDIAELFSGIATQLQEKYPKASIRFQQPGHIAPIQGDRMGLTSIAVNLIENAVKYGGNAPEIHINLQQQNHKIIIEVTDNGIGIPDKEKSKIFDKFYRVGSEDTRKTKGTGLGLYIVKEIVLAHNGKIEVRDNMPRGTVFRIVFSLND